VLVAGFLAATPAAAYRVQSVDALLVTVDGPASEVKAAVGALAGRAELRPGERAPAIVAETTAPTTDRCPDPSALTAAPSRVVLRVPTERAALASPASGWDQAYRRLALRDRPPAAPDRALVDALARGNVRIAAIEPDLIWMDEDAEATLTAGDGCTQQAGDSHRVCEATDGHWPGRAPVDWHLQASQLAEGRRKVEERLGAQTRRVKIAHFDTGYMPCSGENDGLPPRLRREESRDFTAMRCDAGGRCEPGMGGEDTKPTTPIHSRGHGSGTLSILAGGDVRLTPPHRPAYGGPLGGAPFADVVEYRIAEAVVLWRPSVVVSALRWAIDHDVDVVSMSMGGPPTFAMHDAINEAYCRGVAIFTAAGNNVRNPWIGISTPRTTVFPARYERVVAVGGVTADTLTYARAPWRWDYVWNPFQVIMRGNAGPAWVMTETLVASTPNVPWLRFREREQCDGAPAIRLNGSGTSAATPQVAAAASQWLQYHSDHPFLRSKWRSWEKTELVYRALVEKADHEAPSEKYNRQWFGGGIVRAAAAIEHEPTSAGLKPRPRARLRWDWLADILFSSVPGALAGPEQEPAFKRMLQTEIELLAVGLN
jgi:subtilisin family serine protease